MFIWNEIPIKILAQQDKKPINDQNKRFKMEGFG